MESFSGKLAVVTGGGSGMGRELVRQLAAQGCSVAACDWHPDAMAETASLARADAGSGVLVTSHACDVSDEAQVLRFRDELLGQHARDHVDLVFANAGIGGAGSFVNDSREEWEHTFAVDWWGVYHCARTFLLLLIASGDGVLVNTSSVNGLWAALGPGLPMGTDIIGNTLRAHGKDPDQMLIDISNDFRDKAPLSAAQAATIILDGVRSGTWRILVGQDATMIDERIRANPEAAYDYAELFRGLVPS